MQFIPSPASVIQKQTRFSEMYRYAISCRSFRAAATTAAASSSALQRCRLYGASICPFRTATASTASTASQQQWCRLYSLSSGRPLRTTTTAATTAPSASQRCRLHDPSTVRCELRALPHPSTSTVAVSANPTKYGGATMVAMRHVHCWSPRKLHGVLNDAGATTTTAIQTRR